MSTYHLRHRTSGLIATRIASDTNHGVPVVQSFVGAEPLTFPSATMALFATGAHPEWEAVEFADWDGLNV